MRRVLGVLQVASCAKTNQAVSIAITAHYKRSVHLCDQNDAVHMIHQTQLHTTTVGVDTTDGGQLLVLAMVLVAPSASAVVSAVHSVGSLYFRWPVFVHVLWTPGGAAALCRHVLGQQARERANLLLKTLDTAVWFRVVGNHKKIAQLSYIQTIAECIG
jgi:hypothetical protein